MSEDRDIKPRKNPLGSLTLGQAVRLTPATYAHYVTNGRWIPAKHLLFTATKIAKGLRRGNAHIIVSEPPRHGKPISIEEPVLLANGTYRKLGDIQVGDIVASHRGIARRVTAIHEQGLLPVMKITTRRGRSVVAALDHPFYTSLGWMKVADLRPGNELAILKNFVPSSNTIYSPEEFRLAGYFVGDGACGYNQGGSSINANLTCKDEILLKDICHCSESLGFTIKYSCRYNYQISGGIRNWLRSTTLAGKNSFSKVVPEWVFSAPTHLAMQFVGAYYECDGSIDRLGPQRTPTPTFNSVSRELLEGVQSILLRIGVSSNLGKAHVKVNGEPYASYRLTIGKSFEARIFIENVPTYGEKVSRTRRLIDEFFSSKERKERNTGFYGYAADDIISIETAGEQECKCLTVEEDETFIVRDIVVHNSELISIHTPNWWLDEHPEDNIMLTTYGQDLATDHARRVRDMILADASAEEEALLEMQQRATSSARGVLSAADIALAQEINSSNASTRKIRTRLRKDSLRVDRFMTTEGGGMFAIGVGGSLTGRGADLLLIDDFIKNAQEAESHSDQESLWDWYSSTAYSRLEPNASQVILATRWNVNDLIGRILTSDFASDFEYIRLPAISEGPGDPLGRPEGAALWPERYDEDALARIKRVQGSYFWNALYQQDPRPRGETRVRVESIEIISANMLPHPSKLQYIRAWDTAATEDAGDYTAGLLCAIDTTYSDELPIFYIIHIIYGQLSPSRVHATMQSTAIMDTQATKIGLEQEPGSAGKTVVEHLKNNILRGFDVKITRSSQDKFLRAQPLLAAIEDGRVKLVKCEHAETLIEELRAFPRGAHDDLVDGTALAYNTLTGRRSGSVTWGRNASKIPSTTRKTPLAHTEQQEGANYVKKGNLITGITFGRKR